jgi:hypothetical protein
MILTDNSERLNSIIVGRKICRIKFHRGVEFKFAIKSGEKNISGNGLYG